MSIVPEVLTHLISEIDRRLGEIRDNREKGRHEMARKLFVKHDSGNPLKGMSKVDPNLVDKLKIIDESEGGDQAASDK